MGDIGSEGGYGDEDYATGGSAEPHSSNTGDVDVDTIMRMNRDYGKVSDSSNELDISPGGTLLDEMDGESDGSIDESEMSYMGEKPLESNWWDDVKNKADDLKFDKLGSMGKDTPQSIGKSGPTKDLGDDPGPAARRFSTEPFGKNPYVSPEVPKLGLKTSDYGEMVTNVLGLLAKSSIRKPTISSLV